MTTERAATAPLALVTGASSGIGFQLAKQFAELGFELVINAEDDGIHAAADQLRGTGAVVTAVQADLCRPEGVERVHDEVRSGGRPLAAAALNAGVGRGGTFVEIPLADHLEIIDLNVRSTVHLARLVLADMAARGEGRVLFTSSIASTTPGTRQAVYHASKSFVQSFAEALEAELEDTGVTITSLMPGPTETNFFHRARMDDTRVGSSRKDDPAQVARQGVEALMGKEPEPVAGSLRTRVTGVASRVLPELLRAAAHRKPAEPRDSRGPTGPTTT